MRKEVCYLNPWVFLGKIQTRVWRRVFHANTSRSAVDFGRVKLSPHPAIESQFGHFSAVVGGVPHSFKYVHETLIVEGRLVRRGKSLSLGCQILRRCKPTDPAFSDENSQIPVKGISSTMVPAFIVSVTALTVSGMEWNPAISSQPSRL